MTYPFEPDYVVAPASVLTEWMAKTRLSVKVLAAMCHLPASTLEEVLERQPLSEETARGLETGTAIPAEFWLNFERIYRDGLAAGKSDVT